MRRKYSTLSYAELLRSSTVFHLAFFPNFPFFTVELFVNFKLKPNT